MTDCSYLKVKLLFEFSPTITCKIKHFTRGNLNFGIHERICKVPALLNRCRSLSVSKSTASGVAPISSDFVSNDRPPVKPTKNE